MPSRYKPGDLITMRVLAVEHGLMWVDFDGKQLEIETPVRPMSAKQLQASIRHITQRWQEIMGKREITLHAPTGLKYPMKQWEEDKKRLDQEEGS